MMCSCTQRAQRTQQKTPCFEIRVFIKKGAHTPEHSMNTAKNGFAVFALNPLLIYIYLIFCAHEHSAHTLHIEDLESKKREDRAEYRVLVYIGLFWCAHCVHGIIDPLTQQQQVTHG